MISNKSARAIPFYARAVGQRTGLSAASIVTHIYTRGDYSPLIFPLLHSSLKEPVHCCARGYSAIPIETYFLPIHPVHSPLRSGRVATKFIHHLLPAVPRRKNSHHRAFPRLQNRTVSPVSNALPNIRHIVLHRAILPG